MHGLIRHPSSMVKEDDDIELASLYVGDWISFRGMIAAKVARDSGVAESYISMISNGKKKNVSIKVLSKLSAAIGVPVQTFFVPPSHLGAPVTVKRQEMASLGDIKARVKARSARK